MKISDDRIIEVEVAAQDLEKLREAGIEEKDLPKLGIKRYRPATHLLKEKLEKVNPESRK